MIQREQVLFGRVIDTVLLLEEKWEAVITVSILVNILMTAGETKGILVDLEVRTWGPWLVSTLHCADVG